MTEAYDEETGRSWKFANGSSIGRLGKKDTGTFKPRKLREESKNNCYAEIRSTL